jgi:hypothetical protein
MIPGQYSQAAGILMHGLRETEFQGEIRYP